LLPLGVQGYEKFMTALKEQRQKHQQHQWRHRL
jgi:hypothetical protein